MIPSVETLDRLRADAGVPGISAAWIGADSVTVRCAGVTHAATHDGVTDETIFDTASLSKPVFAYAVLQLLDAGYISLETRLADLAPDYVSDDPRSEAVTVRHALCHSTGLPNWRSAEFPLRSHFPPGVRFSYSGEGFTWLQRAIERRLNEPLDDLMRRLVFRPLAMTRSSYVWQPDYEPNHAAPHDSAGRAGAKRRPSEAMVAFSLHSTAGDYARFLRAVLTGRSLRFETAALWLKAHMPVRRRGITALRDDAADQEDTGVSWGLGWGVEPARGMFFQWGDNDQGRHKTFAAGSVAEQKAVVILTNGSHGMAIASELVGALFPGDQRCFDWLGYAPRAAKTRLASRAQLPR